MKEKKLTNVFKGDKGIWMIFFFLCVISIVEVYSAMSLLSYKSGNYIGPIVKHTMLLVVGVGAIIVTMNVKCKYFRVATPFMIMLSYLLLFWLLVAGSTTNGAVRWIDFGFVQFQPSEIAKGTIVLFTAQILSAMQTESGAEERAFKWILILALPMIALIGKENFSTAALILGVVMMMMFIGRVPMRQLGALFGVLCIAAMLGIALIFAIGQDEPKEATDTVRTETVYAEEEAPKEKNAFFSVVSRATTWRGRIMDFLDRKDVPADSVDLTGKGAQKAYSSVAIASSNVIGRGPGNSQTRDFLSQAFSDFIYAIIIEEMGIFGAIFVAMLYIILLFRAGKIANRCENTFPAFLAMGLALMLVLQALFNMCVAVGLAPVTGQPLPFVSRGGTSTIINCVYIGVLLSISRTAKRKNAPATVEA